MKHALIPVLAAVFASPLAAATLEGQFAFEKNAPAAALVWFTEDSSLKAGDVTLVQKDKIFTPNLVVAAPGGKVVFKNEDDLQHNIYADDKATGVAFDTGLDEPKTSRTQDVTWPAGQVLRCGCKIHPQMQAWVACLTSAVNKPVEFPAGQNAASFTLTDVPAGLTKVAVWTPRYEQQEVALEAGKPAVVEFAIKGKKFGTLTLTLKP